MNKICKRCNITLENAVIVQNLPENCKEYISWKYMEIGEGMHFDCYIETVIDKYLEKK
jgi:hypothetical protein